MYKKILPVCVMLMSLALMATAQNNSGPKAMHQVVFEITGADSMAWKGLMKNLKNIKARWGDSVQIEVVAHGPAINMLVAAKATEQKSIAELTKKGVAFMACQNSMKANNLTKEMMIPEAGYVPSGVVEVVTKQEQGWTYLKF